MRGNRYMTEALAVRAELADLGVYRISCGHAQSGTFRLRLAIWCSWTDKGY